MHPNSPMFDVPAVFDKDTSPYVLYNLSVQYPEGSVRDLHAMYAVVHPDVGRLPTTLHEDFAAVGQLSAAWVAECAANKAVAVDIDHVPMDWGEQNLKGYDQSRLARVIGDCRHVEHTSEITHAGNFSWMLLTERAELMAYLNRVYVGHKAVEAEGRKTMFVLEAMDGPGAKVSVSNGCDGAVAGRIFDCNGVEIDDADYGEVATEDFGFEYIWEQSHFDPKTGIAEHRIHFRFADGSEQRKAFVYPWRLYSIAELADMLLEVGFRDVRVFHSVTVSDPDDPDGKEILSEKPQHDETLSPYVVALL